MDLAYLAQIAHNNKKKIYLKYSDMRIIEFWSDAILEENVERETQEKREGFELCFILKRL